MSLASTSLSSSGRPPYRPCPCHPVSTPMSLFQPRYSLRGAGCGFNCSIACTRAWEGSQWRVWWGGVERFICDENFVIWVGGGVTRDILWHFVTCAEKKMGMSHVTKCHKMSQNVTKCHKMSQDVTRCHMSQNVTKGHKISWFFLRLTACHRIPTRFLLDHFLDLFHVFMTLKINLWIN